MKSKALALPGRDQLNLGMLTVSALGMVAFLDPSLAGSLLNIGPEELQLGSLGLIAGVSSLLGLHLTASIGGADMPVVITILNSYSGWALCAEGFMIGNPLLTQVGALIGFSGAILTWIMCEAMGRNVVSVILGGAGTKAPIASEQTEMEGEVTISNIDNVIEQLQEAKNIMIVPGYGLAVAQAQVRNCNLPLSPLPLFFTHHIFLPQCTLQHGSRHQFAVADIAKKLRDAGKNVRFG